MSFQNPVFIPGPTNMPEALRRACDMPTLDHRSSAFADILQPARDGVRKILRSEGAEVFIFPATGTGGWEVAITNTLSPGDTVLAARNGMFSHRWIDMCQRHGLTVEIVETPWGEGIPAARFEEILRADKDGRIKAVLATHNETATGVLSDIAAVRGALNAAQHPALLFVDGVSSIGSMPFEFDAWGVDVAVTGSQKGFMLPAGLAITGFSRKALAAVETGGLPRCFYDIRDMAKSYAANGYPYTPAVGLLNGLNQSCQMILAEGSTPSSPATPASPMACAPRWRPGGWSSAPRGPSSTPIPSARSARRRGSMPPASSPMPPTPMASPSALALARSRARSSVSGIWGCSRTFWHFLVSRPRKWRWPIWVST
jgi:alanine-glyoxylate transaminase/serine-glyoxylate transaminase/serine-pyruvate transaminase